MNRQQSAVAQRAQALLGRLSRHRLTIWLMRLAITLTVPRQRIGAGIVLFNDQGAVLLLRHVFHGNTPWGLPGGWLNRNEDPADGALRELYEETGLYATLGPVVFLGHMRKWHALEIVYLGRAPQGTLRLSFEVREARWFDPTALPAGMLPKVRAHIEAAHRLCIEPPQPIVGETLR